MATQRQSEAPSDDEAFRTEVQQFLRDNFPEELKNKGNLLAGVDGPTDESTTQEAWRKAVGARG